MSTCSCHNKEKHSLLPAAYRIISITRHTPQEWNFRVEVDFPARWGQFVEVSLPCVGEAPISVSDFLPSVKATGYGCVAAMVTATLSMLSATNLWWSLPAVPALHQSRG